MTRFFLLFLSLMLVVFPAVGQQRLPSAAFTTQSDEDSPPRYLAAELIAFNSTPNIAALTSGERAALEGYVAGLPRFPHYLFSGCHDRAHAAYLLLPEPLRARAAKLWVFAPSLYTSAIRGRINIRGADDSLASLVGWGYHVALAFRDSSDFIVYDAALAPDRVLTRQAWFDMMAMPEFTFWTLLPGSIYGFNRTESARWSPNGQVFNGSMFPYTDSALVQHWIPKALARDAVGEAIADRSACEALRPLLEKPDSLLTLLTRNKLPNECSALRTLFEQQFRSWVQRLGLEYVGRMLVDSKALRLPAPAGPRPLPGRSEGAIQGVTNVREDSSRGRDHRTRKREGRAERNPHPAKLTPYVER